MNIKSFGIKCLLAFKYIVLYKQRKMKWYTNPSHYISRVLV